MQEKIKKYLILLCAFGGIVLPNTGWCQMRPARTLRLIEGVDPVMVQVTSSDNTIILDYEVPAATFTSLGEEVTCCGRVRTITRVTAGNASPSGSEGNPVLPVIPVTVILPAGKEIDNISVTRTGEVRHGGEYFVEFGWKPVPISCDTCVDITECNCAVYDSDDPYPQMAYNLLSVQKKYGISLAYINLNPVSYLPLSEKVITYTEICLEITLRDASTPPCAELVVHPERINFATLDVENQDALAGYFKIDCPQPPDSSVPPGFCDPAATYDYVIVTNEAIKNSSELHTVHHLIDWRINHYNLTATIVTIEDVYDKFTGRDDPEKLRNFIVDAYNNWETEYVLLGGDIDVVPMRKLWVYIDSEDKDSIPSDLYFQCLDGSFNVDDDDKWGEIIDDAEPGMDWVDIEAEIYIGRASAQDAEEMSNFVFKTLEYEDTSETRQYEPFGLFVGEDLFQGAVFSDQTLDQIIYSVGVLSPPHDYITLGFRATPNVPENELYDKEHPQKNWPKSSIISRINSNSFTIINHLGHSETDLNMKMKNSDADGLTNTSLIFAYSQGCLAGNFEGNCIAEHFTTQTEHGMFAGVYNSRYGFWGGTGDPDNGPSHHLNRQFWDAYFCEGILTFSGMNMDSHEDNIWKLKDQNNILAANMLWCYYSSNLFGDPYTSMWIPYEMNLNEYEQIPYHKGMYRYKQVYKAHNSITIEDDRFIYFKPETSFNNCTFISGRTVNMNPEIVVETGAKVKAFIDPTLYRP